MPHRVQPVPHPQDLDQSSSADLHTASLVLTGLTGLVFCSSMDSPLELVTGFIALVMQIIISDTAMQRGKLKPKSAKVEDEIPISVQTHNRTLYE
jgi:hypothetical protein